MVQTYWKIPDYANKNKESASMPYYIITGKETQVDYEKWVKFSLVLC